jgi:hypothetical protein
LKRIQNCQYYTFVAEAPFYNNLDITPEKVSLYCSSLHVDDIIVQKATIEHGMKHVDPLSLIQFHDFNGTPINDPEFDFTRPRNFLTSSLRIFSRSGENCELLKKAFNDCIKDEMHSIYKIK